MIFLIRNSHFDLYYLYSNTNECSVCGHKGYSPAIEQHGFLSDTDKDPFTFSVNKAIYEELTKTFSALDLDELGRCETCARIQDEK